MFLSNCSIRTKLWVGLGLLVLVVLILSSSGLYATYGYRNLVRSLSWEVTALAELGQQTRNLQVTLGEISGQRNTGFPYSPRDEVPLRLRIVGSQFQTQLDAVEKALLVYREQLRSALHADAQVGDDDGEWETVRRAEVSLARIHEILADPQWMLDDVKLAGMESDLGHLQTHTAELRRRLDESLSGFAAEVRGQYRTLIYGMWITSITGGLVFALFVRLFYRWIILPLRLLVDGSRRVARGQFNYRIHLDAQDEMAELAEALNDMTARFQAIRDDLDRQVQERTKQVVRSEQLASVGFLAAGVAHEINNPLASVAMCAESLEGRVRELLRDEGPRPPEGEDDQRLAVITHYLRMIQDEAFRCKQITEKLLDFSRIGPSQRQHVELGDLVRGVVEMVGHLGKYHGQRIELTCGQPVVAPANPQEIKQVVLNLLTTALDSLDAGGVVRIQVQAREGMAEMIFADNGCGIEPEVLERVFEPFFTRRRAGQGTGLGLSISYRIIADHGGEIHAESPGAGHGATFRVRIPLVDRQELRKVRQAA